MEITDAALPARDSLAPAYNVGDMVYLEDREYIITQAYPILRPEPKDYFETISWKDPRNGPITEFLPADLSRVNEDFREALTSGLLSEQDKGYISGWLCSGESNTRIAQRLSEQFAGRTDTFMLKTGEHADYFASPVSMDVHILDEENIKKAVFSRTWQETAPVLRALWQRDLDGLSRAPVQRETAEPEQAVTQEAEITTIYPGDKNGLPFDIVVQRLPADELARTQPAQKTSASRTITWARAVQKRSSA